MCIVFCSASSRYSLIVAANRDEFLARPTAPAHWHTWDQAAPDREHSGLRVLSGLDLSAGGTWFGISLPANQDGPRRMHFATLTNYTETLDPNAPPKPSRGNLVRSFLDEVASPHQGEGSLAPPDALQPHLDRLEQTKHAYAGFNLLVGQVHLGPGWGPDPHTTSRVRLGYTSNREHPHKRARVLPSLDPVSEDSQGGDLTAARRVQVRGLSNATLEVEPGEVEWPKVKSGAEAVARTVERLDADSTQDPASAEEALIDGLYAALSTAHPDPVEQREGLRHTVLVRPLCIDPAQALPSLPPPRPPAPASALKPDDPVPAAPESEREQSAQPESSSSADNGGGGGVNGQWYATRVQTLLLVERDTGRVVFLERDAYVLDSPTSPPGSESGASGGEVEAKEEQRGAGGRPRWSGETRRFEFRL